MVRVGQDHPTPLDDRRQDNNHVRSEIGSRATEMDAVSILQAEAQTRGTPRLRSLLLPEYEFKQLGEQSFQRSVSYGGQTYGGATTKSFSKSSAKEMAARECLTSITQ